MRGFAMRSLLAPSGRAAAGLSVLPAALAAAALLPAGARAEGITLPAGFNVETQSGPGLYAVLPDGKALYSTGFFGADELSLRQPDGSLTLFATGFGSLAGIAQSPVTGDIVVGDSFLLPALRVLRDLNDDGDALDAGEDTAHPAVLPVLPNRASPLPFDLQFKPGTDELYMSGSTPFGINPTLGVVLRITGASASVFAEGLTFAAGMTWSGGTLYVADTSLGVGHVAALTDGNADGDALDAGEAVDFAAGLTGASDLVRADDGSFYLSGTFVPDFSSASVARLLPDADHDGVSDGVDESFATGFGFTANLTLSEGAGGLQPGVSGDGALMVQDFAGFPPVDRLVRTAPVATLQLDGVVQNNTTFSYTVGGEAAAGSILVISLDQAGITLHGVGDLGLGFGAPHVILPLGPGGGTLPLTLHGAGALVGLHFTAQGFTLQDGEIGISNAIDSVVAP
jgi:hypothetical protein